MPSVSRTFTTTAAPEKVLTYLADFAHAEEWDPGTQRCVPNEPGPVQVGSSWHNESKIAGVSTELTYTLEKWTSDQLVLVGRNDTATSTETISVTPADRGSEITYRNDIELKGAAKIGAPVMKLLFEKLGVDTEKKLTAVLDDLPA